MLARTPAHFPEVGFKPGGFLEYRDQLCLAGRRGVEISKALQVRACFHRHLLVRRSGILGDPDAIRIRCDAHTRTRCKANRDLCVADYAGIAARLAARPDARDVTNPYRVWIDEYAGAPYQEVAAKAWAHLDHLADLYVTPAREAELLTIFKEATRLETDFWEMGWRAGLRGD